MTRRPYVESCQLRRDLLYCTTRTLVERSTLPPVFIFPGNTALLANAATHLPGVASLAPV